jgi:hypothetical protein
MKQTAVEWLLNNLISEPYSEADFKHNKECWDKAEVMEKEQIKDAFEIGYENGACVNEEESIYHGSNYYNKTFKSE